MKTNPAKALFQQVARVLLAPAAHGHPGIPPAGRVVLHFDGYKGLTDIIGCELFSAADPEGTPLEADQAEQLLNTRVIAPGGRPATFCEILDDAIDAHLCHRHPVWNDEEGAHGNFDIRFQSNSRRRDAPPKIHIRGSITRRFLSSRTSKV